MSESQSTRPADGLVARVRETLALLAGKLPEDSPFGIVGEFTSPGALLKAAGAVRKAGYRRFDTYSPFPIHGMDKAMRLRWEWLPWLVLGGGVTGCIGGFALQIWVHVFEYPLVISGKPHFSLPAFIPVGFETTILLAAFGAVGGMFALNLLPLWYHPLDKHSRFARASDDGFFLSIQARDANFDPDTTRELLESLGAIQTELLEP
jgi:ActD protein